MEYYKSNAIYDHIVQKQLSQYKFVSGNAWQLVYGDNSCNPLLLILAAGVPYEEINNEPTAEERFAFSLLQFIADKAKLPIRYIRFASDVDEIENVRLSDSSFVYSVLSMPELSDLFASFGLPISNTRTAKYLNDRTSSAYHNWQRGSLGVALTVSDIDLWRINDLGEPEIVFELKRSYYELNRWQPFTDDYNNFRLISNLCNKASIQFKIIYNKRTKNPFREHIDSLKTFSVDFSKNPSITEDGIITLPEFENL